MVRKAKTPSRIQLPSFLSHKPQSFLWKGGGKTALQNSFSTMNLPNVTSAVLLSNISYAAFLPHTQFSSTRVLFNLDSLL
jgi:hypothetical protein